MKVREAILEDHDAIMELMKHLNPDDVFADVSVSLKLFEAIVASKNFTLLVFDLDTYVVGTCYLNVIPNLTRNASPYAVIENVVTLPTVRKKGIGKALMDAAIKRAFEVGCYKVMLFTGRDDGVQEFYKNCGMEGESKRAFVVRKR